jgi:8-oxo-dGTP pyrophosphatase MutT (NUDIX family)
MKKLFFATASRTVLHPWSRLSRGMTLGVRLVILRGSEVLLVRHTYAPGWMLPGGGVDRGETAFDAAVREAREECGIIVEETPRLHGLFSNEDRMPGDHIACFVVRQFSSEPWKPSLEIAESRFFPIHELPRETTGGTRRRIDEVVRGTAAPAVW